MKKVLISALIVVALTSILALRTHQIIKGVWTVQLVANCQAEIYDTTTQPFTTLVMACPRMDAIRFWPLPVVQPWFEDWHEKQPVLGENAHILVPSFKEV